MKISTSISSILCIIFLFGSGIAHAQTPEAKQPRYILYTKPFLLFDGEYKLGFEKAISQKEWIGVGLSGFYLPGRDGKTWSTRNTIGYADELETLKGFGIDLTYKQYIVSSIIYLGGDVFYDYYQAGHKGWRTIRFTENGLTFYKNSYGRIKREFNKVGANAYIGMGTPLTNRLFADIYLGAGYSNNINRKDVMPFDDIFGFGYKGFYPVLGLRIGLTIGN